MKKVLWLVPVVAALALPSQAFARPDLVSADVCPTMDGKAHPGGGWEGQRAPGITVSGNDEAVTITVDAGWTLVTLCVKTGRTSETHSVDVVGPATFTVTKAGPGEGISHLSFDVEPTPPPPPPPPAPTDVCPDMDGVQTSDEGWELRNGQCVNRNDLCSNIGGVQTRVPDGLVRVGDECVPPSQAGDVCSNIEDVQLEVPAGLVRVGGECVPPSQAADACPNIEGVQTSVPAGMTLSNGQCVAAAGPAGAMTDDCPNIAGVQGSVPAGMTKDAQGNCVSPSSAAGTPQQPVPQQPGAQPPQPTGGVAGEEKTVTPKAAAKKIRSVGRVAALPFTGIPLGAVALAGLLLLGSGLALRRVQD